MTATEYNNFLVVQQKSKIAGLNASIDHHERLLEQYRGAHMMARRDLAFLEEHALALQTGEALPEYVYNSVDEQPKLDK